MRGRGHRQVAHTADVGLVAWGPTLADAFAEAILGTTSVTFALDRIQPRIDRDIRAAETDPTRLLVDLLDEVLYLVDTEGFVPSRAEVELTPEGAVAHLSGAVFDPSRHRRAG